VVADIIKISGQDELVGFLDPNLERGVAIDGVKVLGSEQDIVELRDRHQIDACIIGVGDNAVRRRIAQSMEALGFDQFANAIHPNATLSNWLIMGSGIVVCAGVCVNSGAKIGCHALLNTNATIDHDSCLGDFSSVAPGAVLGGGCQLGDCSAVGIGAILKHGVSVGENTVVGAGALVLKSVESNAVAYGFPSKFVRGRRFGEPYLK
jgi:sugar O-acyltransferase (sialic acid O-acetyltransferase NeuD family)